MSGKPAARQGDMTQYGGSIVQGSAGVRIGAPTGVACSVCPGGVTSGHPVNPLLGAKVLPGETDIALPGPLPFILSRTYSSYRTKTPAPVGSLGPGWKMPADIRVETATGELARTQRRSLADALQQSGGEDGGSVVFPPVLVQMLDRLESEILADRVSEESRRWLASCGLTVEQMQNQMDPVYTPARKIHLYHCDHRGLPLALISTEGATAWCAEYDEWGNLLNEENPHQLQQLIRLPGQQYDEESGLYYNRHRYYDPLQGRYITQDPIGLKGGWNFYQYPLNPISNIDPLGLETLKCIKPLHSMGGTGERSGPDIWGNPFYHQYLCVPDGKGDYTCGGQDQRGESKGDGLWGPGKASNDTKEAAGRCDLVETDNSCVENCLKGKFKEVRPRYSVLPDIFTPINLGLFKNCQDWSNDSLETCKMKCSGNNIGRFIRFVFTGVM
ncbi:rhsC element core protein RshC [Escherichia coli]|nr:RHS repeat-associated core domain-containing protein [Escherichia coli]SQL60302.1 rhsC element core protein RshC [Escherichia coli]